MMHRIWFRASLVGIFIAGSALAAMAEEESSLDNDARLEHLEKMLVELQEEVKALRAERTADKAEVTAGIERVSERIEEFADDVSLFGKLEFGGYAEIHANFEEGSQKDLIDIHRFVLYAGYEFNDWIRFHSETELEHAFVNDGNGEVSLEQFYVDFLFSEKLNLRIGRFLTPLGIINRQHEPPSFNGVERPSFAKYIIPTTWSSDGIGIFGSLLPSLKYELYVAGGLDGSKFSPLSGIRSGRIKERPSLNDVAVMGRLDYFPFVKYSVPHGQILRLGLSGYYGGVENGNNGKNPSNSDANLTMVAADFEYTISKFDFRGVGAYAWIDDAHRLGHGVAEEMAGWYLESAYHVMPDSWKRGRWDKSDAVVFLRYDDYDTQLKRVSGVRRVRGGDRSEWTTGVNFYFTPNIVLKADYQLVNDDAHHGSHDRLNLGMGMQF